MPRCKEQAPELPGLDMTIPPDPTQKQVWRGTYLLWRTSIRESLGLVHEYRCDAGHFRLRHYHGQAIWIAYAHGISANGTTAQSALESAYNALRSHAKAVNATLDRIGFTAESARPVATQPDQPEPSSPPTLETSG